MLYFKKKWVRYNHNCKIGLHEKWPLFLSDFNETIFHDSCFENYSNTKFHDNPPSGRQLFHADGETDRQTWQSWVSFFAFLRKHLKFVYNKTWIRVSRQEFILFYKTFRVASQKVSWGLRSQGQSGRSTKLTTHFHLIPGLITSAATRLNPLFVFTAEQR